MKKIFVVSFMLMFTLMISAQNRGFGGANMDEMYAQMKTLLSLNDQQMEKVKTIYSESMTKMREQSEQIGDDREKRRELMTKVNAERAESLKKVLTEEQFKKYQAWEEERRQNRQRGN
jgi:Spy/CpxP family protein refolding chaperone